VNSIRDATIALDTNEFVFAIRRDPNYPACERLLFDGLIELNLYMPLQILLELQRNLSDEEMRGVLLAITRARSVIWDYAPAGLERVAQWEERGAKKGDAVIAAHLEAHGVQYFVSENRHFLGELPTLPFQVLTSQEVLDLLG
jgi:predicted nucleic-acid-binding protein